MDDDSQQDGGQRIDVTISGAAAPVAPPPTEPAPTPPPAGPTPSGPHPGLAEAAAPAPPAPGTVVTSGDGTIGGPPTPAQAVTSGGGPSRGKRILKTLFIILLLAALVAGGWFIYDKFIKPKPAAAPKIAQNKDIKQLNIGIVQANYGDKLYPDVSVNEYSFLTNSQMFEGLVRYENKSKIVPDLASNWTNPDGKTWLFTIKDGVKFHDGHTLAASDVKYSLDTVIAQKSDLAQTYASTISKVELVGQNQVKITTTDPDPTLLNKLTFLYIIDANLPKGDEQSQAGTGPYQIKPGTTPTDSSVQMVAFNQYHGGAPKTKALDFGRGETATDMITDFNNHKYNIVGPIPLGDISKATNATKFVTTEPDTRFIGFNTVKAGPLQNKLVRQAISEALDPAAIGKAAGNQITPLNQLIPESIPGYNPAIMPSQQNVAKAKQLLAQAGYPKGLTITFSTSSDPKEVDEIVKELKAVGITAKVDRHDNFDEFIDFFSGGKAEMYSVDYSSDTLDGLDVYNTLLQTSNYNNPALTKLLSQAGNTTNPAERLKLLQQAAVIINQDIAAVPLSTQNDVWLMDRPYSIQQDAPSSLISAYFYKVQLR
jgi:peptide/nickel transport system substrate-binding protein